MAAAMAMLVVVSVAEVSTAYASPPSIAGFTSAGNGAAAAPQTCNLQTNPDSAACLQDVCTATNCPAATFYGNAAAGGTIGEQIFSSTQAIGQTESTSQAIDQEPGATGLAQSGQPTTFYQPGAIGSASGALIDSAETANLTSLQSACSASWPSTMSEFTTYAVQPQSSLDTLCTGQISAMLASARTNGVAGLPMSGLTQSAQAAETALDQMTTLASSIDGTGKGCNVPPACNVASQQIVQSAAEQWNQDITFGDYIDPNTNTEVLPSLTSACQDLPTTVTVGTASGAAAALSTLADDMNAALDQPGVQTLANDCAYGASYTAVTGLYPNLSAYAANPLTNLTNPSNASTTQLPGFPASEQSMLTGFVANMLAAASPTSADFSSYFNSCTSASVDIPPASTTTVIGAPTSTSTTTANSVPVAVCGEPQGSTIVWSPVASEDWDGVTFPDQTAQVIAPGCGNYPQGDTVDYTYVFTPQIVGSGTIVAICNDSCTVSVNGTVVGSYNDGNSNSNFPPPSVIPVQFTSGPNYIVVANTNSQENMGALIAGYGAFGTALGPVFQSNGTWQITTSSTTVTPGAPGTPTTVTIPGPGVTASATTCNAVVRCMGTGCHDVINSPNTGFAEAATALQALKMMQTDIQCSSGTSIAADNCQPIVFGGNPYNCRTFLGVSQTTGFTSNCCNEGLQVPVPPIGQYISGLMDVYNIATTPMVDSWAMSFTPVSTVANGITTEFSGVESWGESAYANLSAWSTDAWRYVSAPFKNLAEQIGNSLGVAGGGAEGAVCTLSGAGNGVVNYGGLLGPIKNAIYQQVFNLVKSIVGPSNTALAEDIMAPFAPTGSFPDNPVATYINGFAGDVMLAYTVYQLATIITQLITACTNEEFQLGYYRKSNDCTAVGSYCSASVPVLGCVTTKYVWCCYQNPLSNIIASQIRLNQPAIAGGYGSAKNPTCGGFTPAQLAAVDWSQINLSQWLAMLEQGGLFQGTNAAAASVFTPNVASEPSTVYTTSGATGEAPAIANNLVGGGTVTDQNGQPGDTAADNLAREFSTQGNAGSSTTTP
ncbi:MAG: conjugal transfer protein TraN [Acidiphilium sp.]|nr:conjugal transfer protein TraN [Acidiphilium sp.]